MSEWPAYERVLRVTAPETDESSTSEDRRTSSEDYAGQEWAKRLNEDWAGQSAEADYIAPLGVLAGRIATLRGLPRPDVETSKGETALIEEEAGYSGGEL